MQLGQMIWRSSGKVKLGRTEMNFRRQMSVPKKSSDGGSFVRRIGFRKCFRQRKLANESRKVNLEKVYQNYRRKKEMIRQKAKDLYGWKENVESCS